VGQIEQAVAERAAAPKVSPQAAIRDKLDQYRGVITKLLAGTGITEETFVAQIANALRANPDLWKCTPETVLGAALRCAQLGLAPNDPRNLASIIPYKNVATFQLGYGGVMELARRAVPGLRFDGHTVYPNDEFDVDYGRPDPVKHKPAVAMRLGRGGEAYAWWVRATWPSGAEQVQVLDQEGVEYHRKFSKQPNGKMWTESYDAAALKSCVMDMKRWLPSSAQLVAGFASDDRVVDVRTIAADIADVELEAAPPADVDVETGEIVE
jgi:recombination protein RecT